MKKKIATILLTVAMAGALLAGPALARDSDDYNRGGWRGGEEWREHHPYQGYGYGQQPPWFYGQSRYQGYGYSQQPPWSYGQSRYGREDNSHWPWEDHDGWRGNHGWQVNNGWRGHYDRDHDGD